MPKSSWLLLSILTTFRLFAQEAPTLEQLLRTPLTNIPTQIEVSTASRFAQNSNQSANVTYMITATEIRLFQWQNLAEILQSFPGIYVSSDGAFQYLGVRGLGQPGDFNSRLLFLLDGVRINENIYDAGLLGSDALVDVENIERVEFAAGPGAAVYGNNAFFGVVNILTKTAQQLRGGSIKMALQSDGATRYFFSSAHRQAEGAEWWFTAGHQQYDEMPLGYTAPEGYEQDFSRLNNEHLTRLRLGGKYQGLSLQLFWSAQKRLSPTLIPSDQGWLVEPVQDQNDNTLVSLSHQQQLTDNVQISGHLNYSSSLFNRELPLVLLDSGVLALTSEQLGRWYSADVVLQYQGFVEHDVLLGAEYEDDYRQQIEIRFNDDPELWQGYYGHNLRKSLFLQDHWRYNSEQSLLLGARYDESRDGGYKLSPRLGWVWQFSQAEQIKLLYGSAYRAANLYEFAINASVDEPTPHEEEIVSSELSYERRLSPQFSYRIGVFDAKIKQLIRMLPDQDIFSNEDLVNNYGTHVDLDWRFTDGKILRAAWSWQQGKDSSNSSLQNSPRQLVKIQYSQPMPWLNAELSIQALGMSQRSVADSKLAGHLLINAGLSWQLHPAHQLVLHVNNLLDRDIYDRPLIFSQPLVQPGRLVNLNWSWQLW